MSDNKNNSAILVMDSGVGGLSILNALLERLPDEQYIYLADYQFLPYGEKTAEEIRLRCEMLVQELAKQHEIKAVVLACNSATAAAISYLRKQFPLFFFGTEPGIKPAAKRSKVGIAVLATELTLGSETFKSLIKSYANDKPVYALPAPELVYLVENFWQQQHQAYREKVLSELLKELSEPFDTLLLGCTHYHFLKSELESVIKNPVTIIDTSEAISSWVAQKLEQEKLLANVSSNKQLLQIYVTGDSVFGKEKKILALLNKKLNEDNINIDLFQFGT